MKISDMFLIASIITLAPLLIFMSDEKSAVVDLKNIQITTVRAGEFSYRASGEYLKNGFPVDAPLKKIVFDVPIEIMKYQVSVGDYEACVVDGNCEPRNGQGRHNSKLPATGISYINAISYAAWLSEKTDFKWRLPTDQEWSYSAGSRFVDDALKIEEDTKNIAKRWLAKYQKFARLDNKTISQVSANGFFGANENGIYDMSGNIWEWTDTCYKRTRLDAQGDEISTTQNCGVRISAGRHRAYISSFIQDARGGGCSVGVPPRYLGFRLIKEMKRDTFSFILDLIGLT